MPARDGPHGSRNEYCDSANSANESACFVVACGVDRSRSTSTTFGRVQKTPGRFGYDAFLPSPVPRSLPLDEATVTVPSDADRAIGRLAGAGRLLPNPQVIVNAYVTREATADATAFTNRPGVSVRHHRDDTRER